MGAPDVYAKATAGPYALLVSVHPPEAIPGAAAIEVRCDDTRVQAIRVSAAGGEAQPLRRFSSEQIFTGSQWIAAGGAWRLRLRVSGSQGEAETTLSMPAVPSRATQSGLAWSPLGWVLLAAIMACMLLVVMGRGRRWASAAAMGFSVGLMVVLVGPLFWGARSASAPPAMQVAPLPGGGLQLTLPGANGDLVDDHGHRMHLFAVRQPEMDVLLHLHPEETAPGIFTTQLPSMAGGGFILFADVVHGDGRPETFTAAAGLPTRTGSVLTGDDSLGVAPGLTRSVAFSGPGTSTARLMDGYRMTLELPAALVPRRGQLLQVKLLDPSGQPPDDMQLYMGMTAHAEVLKQDGSVFAHIHPAGSMPMMGTQMDMLPASDVSFAFGFPSPGGYRLFLQMKHGGVVETGAFDLVVAP